MKIFTVWGSHGEMTACALTGVVMAVRCYESCPCGDNCYAEHLGTILVPTIYRFNVHEWEQHYKQPIDGMRIDILDLGYWLYKHHQYEPPEEDWRRMMADMEVVQ